MKVVHVLRKPLVGTVAGNVLKHGVGGLNINATRIGSEMMPRTKSDGTIKSQNLAMAAPNTGRIRLDDIQGRWPANFILQHDSSCGGDGCPVGVCPVGALDAQSGQLPSHFSRSNPDKPRPGNRVVFPTFATKQTNGPEYFGETGGASRYFWKFYGYR